MVILWATLFPHGLRFARGTISRRHPSMLRGIEHVELLVQRVRLYGAKKVKWIHAK